MDTTLLWFLLTSDFSSYCQWCANNLKILHISYYKKIIGLGEDTILWSNNSFHFFSLVLKMNSLIQFYFVIFSVVFLQ